MRLKLLYYYSAYEVLSDPKKKKQYDQFGENFNKRDEHQDFAYNFNFDDFMKNFHENFGDFHQHFHTQNRKTNGRKTPEMFNFGNIFSVSDNDNRSLIYTSIVTFAYIFI